jgi:hypothetical protein
MERKDKRKIGLRLETQVKLHPQMLMEEEMTYKMAQLQSSEEKEPNKYTHRKILSNGSSLYVVPPLTDQERYDIVLVTPDGLTFHFNRNRTYMPLDIAKKFFSGIQVEEDFDMFLKEYWGVLKKFKQN